MKLGIQISIVCLTCLLFDVSFYIYFLMFPFFKDFLAVLRDQFCFRYNNFVKKSNFDTSAVKKCKKCCNSSSLKSNFETSAVKNVKKVVILRLYFCWKRNILKTSMTMATTSGGNQTHTFREEDALHGLIYMNL